MVNGFSGPIGLEALADFAIARAFYVANDADRNRGTATCKICGVRLLKGHGMRATVAGRRLCFVEEIFLCPSCVEQVRGSLARTNALAATKEGDDDDRPTD